MGVIFIFSHQPGNESAELSGGATQVLLKVLETLNISIDGGTLHYIIRKMAHFTIFFILGCLWYITFRSRDILPNTSAFTAFAICVGYAFFDETHQYFIPGRACQMKDVIVDSAGAGCAIAIGWLLRASKKKAVI